MSRAVLVEHQGRRILRLDHTGLALADLESALGASLRLIGAAPEGLRLLVMWSAPLSPREARALCAALSAAGPGLAAVVFRRTMQKVFFDSFTGRNRAAFGTFDDEATARDWLASGGPAVNDVAAAP